MDIKVFCSLGSISFLPALASNAKKKKLENVAYRKIKQTSARIVPISKPDLLQVVGRKAKVIYSAGKKRFNYTLPTPEFILILLRNRGR